nr:uroporphyrinogen-III C-methyltransferase [Zoogloeaceae bacterium]
RTFSADLAQARAWIERYFDTREEEVVRAIADLTELEKQSISAQPPTLEDTFAALRIVQARTPAIRPGAPQTNSDAGSGSADANR